MAINVTNRKATFTGNTRADQSFTVALECENTTDVEAYAADGTRYRNGVDFTVTNNTIPGVSSNTITLTFPTAIGAQVVTVYRTSDRTQTINIQKEFTNDLLENALDRITLAAQNSLSVSGNVWDLNAAKIMNVAEPTEDTDASTLNYLQSTYSKKGYIPPAVTTVDAGLSGTGKVLYAESTTSVTWRDAFDVPFPGSASKVLQVNSQGVPTWVSPPDYAPAYPTDEPKYLSVGSSAKAWRTVKQMPTLAKGDVGDTLQYQYDDKWAWKTIRWLDDVPGNNKYLHNVTGTGTDGAISSITTTTYSASKATYIQENDTDLNAGGETRLYATGKTSQNRIPLLEFDLSSLSAASYTDDTLVSVLLRVYPALQSSANRDFVIKRVKNSFTQGTGASGNSYNHDGASWANPNGNAGSPDWNWGGGTFDPEKELDHELPVYTMAVGGGSGGMTTGQYNDFDIKDLFLDALNKRSGILRIAIYDPNASGASRYMRFWSNTGTSEDLKLQVKNATARKAYWQPWNYSHVRSPFVGESDPTGSSSPMGVELAHGTNTERWSTNPHVFAKAGYSYRTQDTTVKGGHTVAGKAFACAYSFANHTEGGITTQSNTTCHPVAYIQGGENPSSVGHFLDLTCKATETVEPTGRVEYPDYYNLRTSIIWLADE